MPYFRIIYTALLLFIALPGFGQLKNPGFARHLIQGGNYQEVIDLQDLFPDLDQLLDQDSLDFYTAWSYFNLKKLPEAISEFSQVSDRSAFYPQSKIFRSWCQLYSDNPEGAKGDLFSENGSLLSDAEVYRIQVIAIQLKEREFLSAQKGISALLDQNPFYIDCLQKLSSYTEEAQTFRSKSMALAGIFSGLLPGSGKIYAGEKGAGISTLLIMAGLGGVAAENILKSGLVSWNSLLLTGLFGTFYIGNIYGSLVSIKTYRDRFYEGFDQAVLATVLLPLRDYYR